MIELARPIRVGFWKSTATTPTGSAASLLGLLLESVRVEDFDPDVRKFVDQKWDSEERRIVVAYVEDRRFRSTTYFGHSPCRFCGKDNGVADFTDKTYVWPEGFGHYLREHGVRPPLEFVAHVRRRLRDGLR